MDLRVTRLLTGRLVSVLDVSSTILAGLTLAQVANAITLRTSSILFGATIITLSVGTVSMQKQNPLVVSLKTVTESDLGTEELLRRKLQFVTELSTGQTRNVRSLGYRIALRLFRDWFDMLNSMSVFNEDVMEDMYSNAALWLANNFPDVCTYDEAYRSILA
jgi:hypothetical protein